MVWAPDKIGRPNQSDTTGNSRRPANNIRGMPKKRWIDNIAERTGKSFAQTSSHGTHRQEWRELTEKSIMTRGAMGPMQKTGRSVEYVVWCVIRLNNTATPVCIEIHLGRTLPYNEHNT